MPYSFKRPITFPSANRPDGNLSNFPVVISGTYAYLRTVANGGSVQSANGHDIAFFADGNLTTKLDHEVERWIATTGEYIAWVRIPTLTGTTDTVIWLAYGDSSITTSQQVPTGVWDSNFFAVLHLRDGTTLNTNDSTAAARNYTQINNPTAIAGKIGGAARLNTSPSAQYLQGPHGLGNPTAYTFSYWVQSPAAPSTVVSQPFRFKGGSEVVGYSWGHNNATFRNAFFHRITGGTYVDVRLVDTLLADTWYYMCVTWNGSSVIGYLNGVAKTTKTATSILAVTDNNTFYSSTNNPFNGSIEEIRISNVARSADWIATEFANQNNPATFYTVGAEQINQQATIKRVGETNTGSIKNVGGIPLSQIKKIGGIDRQ